MGNNIPSFQIEWLGPNGEIYFVICDTTFMGYSQCCDTAMIISA